MDIKEFIILKEGFFDSKSYAKFLKFVKNDLQYFDQGIINNRDKGDIKIDSSVYENYQRKVVENNGDFDLMAGIIKNFEYTTREDGAFDCTTT